MSAKKKLTIAALTLVGFFAVLVISAIAIVFGPRLLLDKNDPYAVARFHGNHPQPGVIVLFDDSLSDFRPDEVGDSLSPDQFIAIMSSNETTTLARETFIEAGNGMEVDWKLQVKDITEENDGQLQGRFELDYWFISRERNRHDSYQYRVYALFKPEAHSELLSLKSGDVVNVKGRIEFDTQSVRIVDAKLRQ
ncbi:MAG: hypothetical protein AAF585_06670 [Verrucomicrobiota bacterium]